MISLTERFKLFLREYLSSGAVYLSNDKQKNQMYIQFLEDIFTCKECFSGKLVLPGTGNLDSDIIFLGEAPSLRRFYHLTFGELSRCVFEEILKTMGLRRSDVWTTNAVKCIIPYRSEGDWSVCLKYLSREIEIIKPRYIIALGAVARRVVEELKPNCEIFYMRHPMYYVYRQYKLNECLSQARKIAGRIHKRDLLSFGDVNVRSYS